MHTSSIYSVRLSAIGDFLLGQGSPAPPCQHDNMICSRVKYETTLGQHMITACTNMHVHKGAGTRECVIRVLRALVPCQVCGFAMILLTLDWRPVHTCSLSAGSRR